MNRWKRTVIGVGVPALAAAACLYILSGDARLRCVFYELTGLWCPGCGSGRAVSALLHGQLRRAWSENMLLFVLGIPSGAIFLHEYCRLVFPRLRLRPVSLPQGVQLACVILVFGFWILRNIPAFSFLAPF